MPDRLAARNAAIHKRHARRVSELTDLLQILQRNGGEEYDRQIRPGLGQDTVRTIQDVDRLLRIDDSDQHDVALAGDLDRKSVVQGTSVYVRVSPGGCCHIINKKKMNESI